MKPRRTRSFLPRFHTEGGVAAVELAIVLPLLVLILFGIISFGTVFYNYIVITNAAREGARWGSINLTSSTPGNACTATPSPCTVAESYANGLLINYGGPSNAVAQAVVEESGSNFILRVTMTYQFQGIGFFKTLFDDGLSARSSMYLEP